jgi:hypothetical protein
VAVVDHSESRLTQDAPVRVWNSDVVVAPAELRCHGRRLMVQSLSIMPPPLSIPFADCDHSPSNLPNMRTEPRAATIGQHGRATGRLQRVVGRLVSLRL